MFFPNAVKKDEKSKDGETKDSENGQPPLIPLMAEEDSLRLFRPTKKQRTNLIDNNTNMGEESMKEDESIATGNDLQEGVETSASTYTIKSESRNDNSCIVTDSKSRMRGVYFSRPRDQKKTYADAVRGKTRAFHTRKEKNNSFNRRLILLSK